MKRLIFALFFGFLLFFPAVVFSQSTESDLKTQKRLLEVESKATQSAQTATSSATKSSLELSFISGGILHSSEKVLVIQGDSGQKTIFTVDSTRFLNLDGKGKKLIGFGDLKTGENISVLGISSAAGGGVAKIIVRDTSPKIQTFSQFGRLAEVKSDSLALKDPNRDDLPTIKVLYNSATVFKKGTQTIEPSALAANSKLIVVGTIDDKGNLTATQVQIAN